MARVSNITIVIENGKALRALQESIEIAYRLADDHPWSDDAKRLVKTLRKVKIGLCARKDSKRDA